MKRIIVLSLICLAFLSGCNANSKEKYSEGNLIIEAEINVASCWADEYNETDWIMTKERQERIDWIKTEF